MTIFHNFRYNTFDSWAYKFGVGDKPVRYYSLSELEEYSNRQEQYRKKYIRYFLLVSVPDFIQDVIDIPRTVRSWYRSFHRFFFDRKDIIKLPLKRSYWWDTDTRMEQAIITLVIEYFDKELPNYISDWDEFKDVPDADKVSAYIAYNIKDITENPENHKNPKQTAQRWINLHEAYLYFKYERNVDKSVIEDIENEYYKTPNKTDAQRKKFLTKITKMEEAMTKADTRHFTNVVYARQLLWT